MAMAFAMAGADADLLEEADKSAQEAKADQPADEAKAESDDEKTSEE